MRKCRIGIAVGALGISLIVLFAARSSAAENAERFEPTSCWFEKRAQHRIECGYLVVPERRDRQHIRELRLPVVILKRAGAETKRPPIVYLTGGPGSPVYIGDQWEVAGWWELAQSLPAGHDLVLFDQRGAGLSEPSLHCIDLADPTIWAGASKQPGQQVDPESTYPAAVRDCRDWLLDQGHDLTAYNSRESAADVAALRRVLGIDQWILFGVSYGTRLALTVMRDHPKGVHSAVLDAVVPLQAALERDTPVHFDTALARLFRDCAASSECAASYPNLNSSLKRVLKRLAAEPIELALPEKSPYPAIYVRIDDIALLDILFWSFYDIEFVQSLPFLIHNLARGEYWLLKAYAENFYLNIYWVEEATGMMLSVNCNEEAPFEDLETAVAVAAQFPLLRTWVLKTWGHGLCPDWPSGQADSVENDPVESDIPTLLLAGAYDPRSPLELAKMAAAGLPNSRVFEFPAASHGTIFTDRCAYRILVEFLTDPSSALDPACLASLGPPRFVIVPSK